MFFYKCVVFFKSRFALLTHKSVVCVAHYKRCIVKTGIETNLLTDNYHYRKSLDRVFFVYFAFANVYANNLLIGKQRNRLI